MHVQNSIWASPLFLRSSEPDDDVNTLELMRFDLYVANPDKKNKLGARGARDGLQFSNFAILFSASRRLGFLHQWRSIEKSSRSRNLPKSKEGPPCEAAFSWSRRRGTVSFVIKHSLRTTFCVRAVHMVARPRVWQQLRQLVVHL